ncbi:MAG: hypothetical protein CMO55_21040 [Verrucomicrobiales bacterium]|nr:hypothetical protein [Verrucomicrobiales bacterium]
MKAEHQYQTVPLDSAQMDRFHRVAPGTLARRDTAFYRRELTLGFEFLLTGVIAIVGTLAFGWSAMNWLVFLIIGTFSGILTDTIKLFFLNKPINQHADNSADDQFVGLVCDALRKGEKEIPKMQDGGRYKPEIGLVFDLVFAPVSTLLIYFTVKENGFDGWNELFGQKHFLTSVIGFCAWQLLMTVWEIVSFRMTTNPENPVKILLGGRGVGLFFLFFLTAATGSCTKDQTDYTVALYVANGLLILMGLLNTFGILSIRNDSRWLREYLEKRNQGYGAGR